MDYASGPGASIPASQLSSTVQLRCVPLGRASDAASRSARPRADEIRRSVMSRSALIPSRRMLVLFPFLAGLAFPAAAVTDARVSENYGKLPLHFEANRGQTDKDVRFLSRGLGYSLYLTAREAVLVLAKPDAHSEQAPRDADAQVKSA